MQMKADRTEASQDTHMECKGSAKARATSGRLDEGEGSGHKSQLGGRVRAWQPITSKPEGKLWDQIQDPNADGKLSEQTVLNVIGAPKLLDQTRVEANQDSNADGNLLDQTGLTVKRVVNT
jgi:hypothetical protein